MREALNRFDTAVINTLRRATYPAARIALFVVFFWFGILKVIYVSPANPLVESLLVKTLPFITFHEFIFWFGFYEMAIGIAFLIPGLERLAIALLVPHMVSTFLPLVLLPQITWQKAFVPTLEGQYIIKNLLIIALAIGLASHLHPWQENAGEMK